MIKITDEIKERILRSQDEKKHCIWATAGKKGEPDISFRGSTFVWDDEHIAFWDRSGGISTKNMEENPKVCMLYVDIQSRVGWRFDGHATILRDGDLRKKIMAQVSEHELEKDPERKGAAVLVRVDRIRRYSGDQVVQER
jgi:hypothetical protein